MSRAVSTARAAVPSVDRVLRLEAVEALIAAYGRQAVSAEVRQVLDALRQSLGSRGEDALAEADDGVIAERVSANLEAMARPTLRPVFNLTGTVLHTNLGRAALPAEAVEAMVTVAAGASNLEYDLARGGRGDRDSHLEERLCKLTGAEAATVVNNNAAAVLLVLNTLARRREVPVSRGELIEIGDSFRMPDIMARAGCKLREVGTTNRTHLEDYAAAVGPRTALLMKVHTSNYTVQGFTAAVAEKDLAGLAHGHGLPLIVDLGSGTLVDLGRYGLAHEPTPAETIAGGADLVTFSGDKLLGGPQAGIIVGRAGLVAKIKRNPMKRAMRLDKMTIAALAATLRLYDDPDGLPERLPTLRLLTRQVEDIRQVARRLTPVLGRCLKGVATVETASCLSQVGSGSLPDALLPSAALSIRPVGGKRGTGARLKRIAAAFRALPVPVIGRLEDDALVLDLRCLEDEAAFEAQLDALSRGIK